ncbi:hypothetical protein AB0368_23610 [Actinoplanes sp. NPDC051475]|uniref:hypothetical protein n=1 Tax=Actinoplanes sp. NPDC051475 TaxID=3157225 RepID=UPI00344D4215
MTSETGKLLRFAKSVIASVGATSAVLALLPGVAQANTIWSASSAYGTGSANVDASGNLELALGAMDTKCDSKSAGTLADVYAGGSKQASRSVDAFNGCHSGETKYFYFDISQLGGNTSGYITIRACRAQKIAGAVNYTSCGSAVSRSFSIS